jgi:hypothetical protein
LVRAGQEQSDRREPLPTEHESLTPEERPSSLSGRLRGLGVHRLSRRLHIIRHLPEFIACTYSEELAKRAQIFVE